MSKFTVTKHATLEPDPMGKIVQFEHDGRTLVGEVVGHSRYHSLGIALVVHHFNGEPWPIQPNAALVEILEQKPND